MVIATGKYIGEGFDEPRLDTMLLAMPISWKGTLVKYAGRLHRNYAGKQKVRICDYVDVHVPMLERMYHKRLRGYSELGYQVKIREQNDNTGKIYGSQEYAAFAEDLSNAAISIMIISPYIQKNRMTGLLPIWGNALLSGVRVAVDTKSVESHRTDQQPGIASAIAMLENAEIAGELLEMSAESAPPESNSALQ